MHVSLQPHYISGLFQIHVTSKLLPKEIIQLVFWVILGLDQRISPGVTQGN